MSVRRAPLSHYLPFIGIEQGSKPADHCLPLGLQYEDSECSQEGPCRKGRPPLLPQESVSASGNSRLCSSTRKSNSLNKLFDPHHPHGMNLGCPSQCLVENARNRACGRADQIPDTCLSTLRSLFSALSITQSFQPSVVVKATIPIFQVKLRHKE